MQFRELLLILLIALLIFGGKKLRTIGSDLGAAVRDFKKSMDTGEREEEQKQATQQLANQSTPPPSGRDADFGAGERPAKPEQKTSG